MGMAGHKLSVGGVVCGGTLWGGTDKDEPK